MGRIEQLEADCRAYQARIAELEAQLASSTSAANVLVAAERERCWRGALAVDDHTKIGEINRDLSYENAIVVATATYIAKRIRSEWRHKRVNQMPKRTKSYETGLYERLKDPSYAMEYLRATLEDDEEGSDAVFLLALRDVAKANHMADC